MGSSGHNDPTRIWTRAKGKAVGRGTYPPLLWQMGDGVGRRDWGISVADHCDDVIVKGPHRMGEEMLNLRHIVLSLATLLLGAAAPAPPPADQKAIHSFLVRVYSSYRACEGDLDRCAKPVPWRSAFTPATRRLIALNEKLNDYEAGAATEADPICQCQDYETIRISRITLLGRPDGRVVANVRFTNFGQRSVALLMEKTPLGWRVYDVLPAPGASSYRDGIHSENRTLTQASR